MSDLEISSISKTEFLGIYNQVSFINLSVLVVTPPIIVKPNIYNFKV